MQTNEEKLDDEDQAILAAKAEHGILYPLLVVQPSDDGKAAPKLAFRRPTSSEWLRYRSESLTNDPLVKANALQSIVIPCLVYPKLAEFLPMVTARPGLVELCGGELVEYAGLERAKKVTRL